MASGWFIFLIVVFGLLALLITKLLPNPTGAVYDAEDMVLEEEEAQSNPEPAPVAAVATETKKPAQVVVAQAKAGVTGAAQASAKPAASKTGPENQASPAPAKVAPAKAKPAPGKPAPPDNLRKIEGVGPKIASILKEAGIKTFAQLAQAEVSRLNEILDAAKLQMMDPISWPEQAKLAAAGEWDALQKLQDELKGGR